MIKPFTIALLSAVLLSSPVLASSKALDAAVGEYNNKNYRDAITKLSAIVRANPNDSKAHYYLALSYQGSGQMHLARAQYAWVYNNSSDERLKYQAWQALSNMRSWNQHRAYSGQGNSFQKVQAAPVRSAGRSSQSIINDPSQATGTTITITPGCH